MHSQAQAAQQKSAEARRAEGELMQSRASEDKAIQEVCATPATRGIGNDWKCQLCSGAHADEIVI